MNTTAPQGLGIQEVPSQKVITEKCNDRLGVQPKDEQLEVARFIGLGKDVVLIAGCGWGKSL
ncbi:hypothetical protein BGZ98_001869, partial [Dissophora globulifera]